MAKSNHQIFFIRGGESFDNKEQFYEYLRTRPLDAKKGYRSWRDWMEWTLGETFDSYVPAMPNKQWADYYAWKIWFEKYLPLIKKDKKVKLILVGTSLGATFLIKYLSENNLPKHVDQIHLVCPCIDDEGLVGEAGAKEGVGNFKIDLQKVKNIESKTDYIFIYHSKDDPWVPINHSRRLIKYFKNAKLLEFENRGHFFQPTFMELLENINSHL